MNMEMAGNLGGWWELGVGKELPYRMERGVGFGGLPPTLPAVYPTRKICV